MRADRLLSIILLLQTHHKLTAKDLANQLEISIRTIYRDLTVLSAMQVPIYTEGGPGGGVYLDPNYWVSLTGFDEAEIKSIFLQSGSDALEALGLENAQRRAIHKLQATLPATHQENLSFLQQRIYIDGSRWWKNEQKDDFFERLLEAINQNRCVKIRYERPNGECLERLIYPYGLIARENRWYFVAVHNESELRTYRLSRVINLILLQETFERLPNFDLRSYWVRSSERFLGHAPICKIKLRVDEKALRYVQRYADQNIVNLDKDIVELWFESIDAAQMLVMGLGGGFVVMAPAHFSESIQRHAQRLLDHLKTDGNVG